MQIFRAIYSFLLAIFKKVSPLFPSKKIALRNKGIDNQKLNSFSRRPIWVHVASSGEFEQAKPVIEQLKKKGYLIVVTFLSPSGYEQHKYNQLLDAVYYLPWDTPKEMNEFVKQINPCFFLLVKYEFWLNLMHIVNSLQIPSGLISASFYPNHFLFKWYGKAYLQEIKQFEFIAVQDESSQQLLTNEGVQAICTGDTRVDRSLMLASESFSNQFIELFLQNNKKPLLILGSVWKEDLERFIVILDYLQQYYQLLIAPHELEPTFLQWIKDAFQGVLFSERKLSYTPLIIDKIGLLKYLYRYADVAYIGGGFGKGIHNTLEPASYGIPIIIGTEYSKFIEAANMIGQGGMVSISSASELKDSLEQLLSKEQRAYKGKLNLGYLQQSKGATAQVIQLIQQSIDQDN